LLLPVILLASAALLLLLPVSTGLCALLFRCCLGLPPLHLLLDLAMKAARLQQATHIHLELNERVRYP
jgi:hypothetical protein